jgi:hypothetical protein
MKDGPGQIGVADDCECDICRSPVEQAIRFRNGSIGISVNICFLCVKVANAIVFGYTGELKKP